jgi:hypothetical protein
MRVPLLDVNNVVVTVTEMRPGSDWQPSSGLYIGAVSDTAQPGDFWDGAAYITPPPIQPQPRKGFKARDLVSLFSVGDYALIQDVATKSPSTGLWLELLRSRGEKMIPFASPTFQSAWTVLEGVLGKQRADELLILLQNE